MVEGHRAAAPRRATSTGGAPAAPAPGSLRDLLRFATRDAHRALDRSLTSPDGVVADVEGYVRLLRVLHALHALHDATLRTWAPASPLWTSALPPQESTRWGAGAAGVELPDRAPLYRSDLAVLGVVEPAPGPAAGRGVSDAEGLAVLYLVAGSAAGARVLLRGLPPAVPVSARSGLRDAAGASSTRLWRATKDLLSAPHPADVGEHAARVAVEVLERLRAIGEVRAA